MNKKKNAKKLLEALYDLLLREKEALIRDHAAEVAGILEEKIALVGRLEEIKEGDPSIEDIVTEIQDLQETNQLLTKQALAYQEVLLKSIAKESTKDRETYSPKGGYRDRKKTSTLVDQKL